VQAPPLVRPRSARGRAASDRVPVTLPICRGCDQYVLAHETVCPHCGANVAEASAAYEAGLADVRNATAELSRLLAERAAPALAPPVTPI
jgi:ribosomal protein L32